jgi:hypothetical protein
LPSKLDVVGRQLTRSDGVYIEGAVQGRRIMFTADTGAARTVISKKAFKQIPRDKQPPSNLLGKLHSFSESSVLGSEIGLFLNETALPTSVTLSSFSKQITSILLLGTHSSALIFKTVISKKAFKQIPRDKQPQLKKSSTFAGADGQPLVELGKAMFSINLGQLTMER